jgi:hypothetical protein
MNRMTCVAVGTTTAVVIGPFYAIVVALLLNFAWTAVTIVREEW